MKSIEYRPRSKVWFLGMARSLRWFGRRSELKDHRMEQTIALRLIELCYVGQTLMDA